MQLPLDDNGCWSFFTSGMPFFAPNQQCQRNEGNIYYFQFFLPFNLFFPSVSLDFVHTQISLHRILLLLIAEIVSRIFNEIICRSTQVSWSGHPDAFSHRCRYQLKSLFSLLCNVNHESLSVFLLSFSLSSSRRSSELFFSRVHSSLQWSFSWSFTVIHLFIVHFYFQHLIIECRTCGKFELNVMAV